MIFIKTTFNSFSDIMWFRVKRLKAVLFVLTLFVAFRIRKVDG